MKPLISVIVPVYKTEALLERCIESIRNQTYKNLEIILVDDGSPDRSGEICDSYVAIDNRIKVFHKDNGGQSSARNVGLENATGRYIGFVDSDDWIEPNMYEFLYNLLKDNSAQISACGFQRNYKNGKIEYSNREYLLDNKTKTYTQQEALKETIWNQVFTYSLCDKLYETSIFSDVRFTEGQIYEDEEIIPIIIEKATKLVYNPIPLYHYIMTDESTLRGEFSEKLFVRLDIAKARALDYKKRLPHLYEDVMAYYYTDCIMTIHECKRNERCKIRRYELIEEVKKIPRNIINKMPRNTKIKLSAIKVSPFLYELIMEINDIKRQII